jgi:hypothetical protein
MLRNGSRSGSTGIWFDHASDDNVLVPERYENRDALLKLIRTGGDAGHCSAEAPKPSSQPHEIQK